MKKALLAVFAGLLAFAAGIAGVFYAMPVLAPEVAEQAQLYADSVRLAKTGEPVPIDTAMCMPLLSVADSIGGTLPLANLTPQPDPRDEQVEALEDSVRALRRRLVAGETSADELARRLEALQERLDEIAARREEAAKVGPTLAKLEDRQLKGVLAAIDLGTLHQIYVESSARNRSRLLQFMPSDRAAIFVRQLVDPSTRGGEATTPAAADASVEQPTR